MKKVSSCQWQLFSVRVKEQMKLTFFKKLIDGKPESRTICATSFFVTWKVFFVLPAVVVVEDVEEEEEVEEEDLDFFDFFDFFSAIADIIAVENVKYVVEWYQLRRCARGAVSALSGLLKLSSPIISKIITYYFSNIYNRSFVWVSRDVLEKKEAE